MSFEENMNKLSEIVAELEKGDISLEKAVESSFEKHFENFGALLHANAYILNNRVEVNFKSVLF